MIVKTDTGGAVFENGREENNLGVSEQAFRLGVPSLTLGQAMPGSFGSSGQSKIYYRVAVEAGQHLFVRLDDLNDQGYNELYVKYGSAPTRGDYDARYSAPMAADQVVEISNTMAGNYYLLAYVGSAPDAPADFSLTASVVDFRILGVSPNHGGNAGPVTITVRGANLPPARRSSWWPRMARDCCRQRCTTPRPSTSTPRSNLRGVPPGSYDVRVESTTLSTSIEDIFIVSARTGPHLETNLLVPSVVRAGFRPTLWLEYKNTGDADVPAALLQVRASSGQMHVEGARRQWPSPAPRHQPERSGRDLAARRKR